MHRFIDGEDRMQQMLLPNRLEDYVSEENPVRVIEAFIEELDPCRLGLFRDGAGGDGPAGLSSLDAAEDLPLRLPQPPPVEPALEREAPRNIELMWLAGRLTLVPAHLLAVVCCDEGHLL
jgi:hypothetical protein